MLHYAKREIRKCIKRQRKRSKVYAAFIFSITFLFTLSKTHILILFICFLCATGKVWETVLTGNEASFEGVYNANTEVNINDNKLNTF